MLPKVIVELGSGSVSKQHFNEKARNELAHEVPQLQGQDCVLKQIRERKSMLTSGVDPFEVNVILPPNGQIFWNADRYKSECDSCS